MQLFAFDIHEIPLGLQAVAGIGLLKFGALFYLNKYGAKPWIRVGKVSRLFLYPVKSCRGIELDELEVTIDGGKHKDAKDRHWMIVDGEGMRATQRTIENIALITQTLDDDKLLIDAPGMDTLVLDVRPKFDESQVTEITLTGKKVRVTNSGEHATNWINKFLETNDLKIVHLPPQLDSIDMTHLNKPNHYYARKGDVKGLHDKAPFNFLPQSSLDDLQAKIPDHNIDVHRFRPNVLVDGPEAYDEDNWQRVCIGDNYFTRVAMCSRCIFTTVDQDKPNKAGRDLEPLKTLRTYRLAPQRNSYGQSPVLAAHFCPDNVGGKMRVGDEVYVIKEHY